MNHHPMTVTTPSDREIVLTRVFDAPRPVVFQMMTDPHLIPQWWGPHGYTTIVDKAEMKVGGAWRYIQRMPNGEETAFRGVYREITPPERLVFTFEWEGLPGHVLIETVVFEEVEGGKTRVTDTSLFHTTEERDGMLHSGMEAGARASWDRFADLLVTA